MKKLLLLLSLLTPITSLGASGGGKVDASYIEAVRQGSAPGSPASGKARAYILDSDGKWYVKNSAGTAKACTYSGDLVNADFTGSAGITNANLATMAQSTFKCRTTASTGVPEDCTAAQAQAITGSVPLLMAHQSTPSSPSAGSAYLYFKNDNNLYIKDPGGTETQVQSGAGGVTGFATIDGGDTDGTYGSFHCEIFTTTGNRTLTVSAAGPVMFALVGGGGSGSFGGGGGGGVIDHYWEDVWVDPGSYTVAVGAGATAGAASDSVRPANGGDTTFAGFTAAGGGSGGTYRNANDGNGSGGNGGSGGGGGYNNCGSSCSAGAGGTGTYWKPEVQGFTGGTGPGASGGCFTSAGGGGAGAVGAAGASCVGGNGGAGLRSVVATLVAGGTPTFWGGGGGGGSGNSGGSCAGGGGTGGTGGGGNGGNTGSAGTAGTGGGGGGGCSATSGAGGAGGSGKAIICARIQGS